ncbi:uncharacterized protein [Pyxicephalus adspersus]|uniref:uncharacterized protein n=1 Tax=Pyxicephalus adspersus TaxID=30357 RepID=UPI003B5BF917
MSSDPRNIEEEIERYVPGINSDNSQHGIEKLQILLVGFAGHGKSSLINSTICVTKKEKYRNLAGAGYDVEGRTKDRKPFPITDTIYITDNRGFKFMKVEEILEVCAQLRHLRPVGYVEWEKDNLKETVKSIAESYRLPKELILPVIVHSCLNSLSADAEKSMIMLIKKCQEITGIPPTVVITKIGPPNNRSEQAAVMDRKFGDMGCTQRICLENYTENNQTQSPETDYQFLHFLDVCISEAECVIKLRGDTDPCKILAKYVADQVKEENEVERERMQRKWENKEVERERMQREWRENMEAELQRKQNRVTELEEENAKPWYKKCTVM